MTSRFFIYPYVSYSNSAKALAKALDGKTIKLSNSSFQKTPTRQVINWGSCHCPAQFHPLNPSHLTQITRDKLQTFKTLSEALGSPQEGSSAPALPRLPPWTESRQEASQWLSEGSSVVCRLSLTGQGGSGIQLVEPGGELPEAPLYTKYIKKDAEYRVHVFKSSLQGEYEVIHVQRKIRNPSVEPSNWQIRSHNNGFIFSKNNANGEPYTTACPEDVRVQALKAMANLGLDLGACDMIYSSRLDRAYFLEVNSSPGLEGSTVEIYANAVRRYFDGSAV